MYFEMKKAVKNHISLFHLFYFCPLVFKKDDFYQPTPYASCIDIYLNLIFKLVYVFQLHASF